MIDLELTQYLNAMTETCCEHIHLQRAGGWWKPAVTCVTDHSRADTPNHSKRIPEGTVNSQSLI